MTSRQKNIADAILIVDDDEDISDRRRSCC